MQLWVSFGDKSRVRIEKNKKQGAFLLVLQKITAWVMVSVPYFYPQNFYHHTVFLPIDHLRPSVRDFGVDLELPLAANQRATVERAQQGINTNWYSSNLFMFV